MALVHEGREENDDAALKRETEKVTNAASALFSENQYLQDLTPFYRYHVPVAETSLLWHEKHGRSLAEVYSKLEQFMICLLKEYHRVLANMPSLSNVCDVLLGDVVHPLQYYQPSQVMAVGNVDEAPVCNQNRGR